MPTTLVALTGSNRLWTFDSATPGSILSDASVTGLQAGETLVGIDVRPATGQLFGLGLVGTTGRIYTLAPTTGVATLVAVLAADPMDVTAPLYTGLSGTDFGIDFNPQADRLRVVSDANQNLRINIGASNALVSADLPLAFGASDPNSSANPNVVDVAYSNNMAGAGSTRLFGIEGLGTALNGTRTLPDGNQVPALCIVEQLPPNNGTLLTMASFGRDGMFARGFDIAPSGTAFAGVELHFQDPGSTLTYAVVTIDLATGVDQNLGYIGDGLTAIQDLAVIPSMQFTAALYAVSEDAGTATITVSRTERISTTTVTIDYSTRSGSASAGADYSTVAGTLTFSPSDLTKSFTIPIINDTTPEDDEAILLFLTNPTGGAVLGSPSTAVLRINANDRTDRVGPRIGQVGAVGPTRAITGLVISYNESLNPTAAANLNNYRLVGIRGLKRTVISLGATIYDPVKRQVTLAATTPFNQTLFSRIVLRVNGHLGGLTDVAGNLLDGNRDGIRGGDAVFNFRVLSGRNITFVEADRDTVTLSLTGPTISRLDGLLDTRTKRFQAWILDSIALATQLQGSVRPSARGDGIISISEIIGLDQECFLPTNSPIFRFSRLTFSPNATGAIVIEMPR